MHERDHGDEVGGLAPVGTERYDRAMWPAGPSLDPEHPPSEVPLNTDTPPDWSTPHAAASQWRDRCLIRDRSVFEAGSIWTLENANALDRHYIQNIDQGEGTFFSKLEGQLAGAPSSAIQLAAELFWALYLFPMPESMKAATKRVQIRRVWEWSGEVFPENHPALHDPLEGGLGNPGAAFNTLRWRELYFAIRFTQALKCLGEEERRHLLADPWRFAEWLEDVDYAERRQFRHIVLNLLFPDTFETIASQHLKRDLVKGFRDKWSADPDVEIPKDRVELDRAVAEIRERLEAGRGERIDFYSPEFVAEWRPKELESAADPSSPDSKSTPSWPEFSKDESIAWRDERFGPGTDIWFVGTGQGGRLWSEFKREGVIRIGWGFMGDLTAYDSKDAVEAALAEHPSQGERPTVTARACWEFTHEIKEGDVVIAKRGRSTVLGWGRVRSGYRFDDSREESPHLREVEWERTGSWEIASDDGVTAKTLTCFTPYLDWVRAAFHVMERDTSPPPPPNGPDDSPYTEDDALDKLFLEATEFSSILNLLARKKALVLEGPPGVGKSFVARRVAYALIGRQAPEQVEMVQFHQSYSYEDFVQGLRPAEGGGFERQDGVFLRFCEAARADPEEPFVLVIDEVNRANLSRVFGELLLLLEADKRRPEYAVSLTYARDDEEPFFIPPNVHVLGLMNTADRSLAMVDYALRRRFGFIRLEPAFGREAFTEHLTGAGVPEKLVAHIDEELTDLNRAIVEDARNLGRGFEIGHAYFVPTPEDDSLGEEWFRAIVEYEVAPLLREYWFDDEERAEGWVKRLLAGR